MKGIDRRFVFNFSSSIKKNAAMLWECLAKTTFEDDREYVDEDKHPEWGQKMFMDDRQIIVREVSDDVGISIGS